MFLVGVKTDLRVVSMAGKMGIAIAISTRIILLFTGSWLLSTLESQGVYRMDSEVWDVIWLEQFSFCFSQNPTAVAVIVYILSELRMLNSEVGRIAVSWALVSHFCDIITVIVCSLYLRPKVALVVVLFVLFMFTAVHPFMHWLVHMMHKDEETIMHLTLVLMFIFAYCTPLFEMSPTFGAFLFGLIVPEGPPLGSYLELKVEPLVTGIFLPLFTTSVTMRFSPWDMLFQFDRAEFAIRLGLACFLVKLFTTFLPSLLITRMHWKEALVISLLLSSKGFSELVYYIRFKDRKVSEIQA